MGTQFQFIKILSIIFVLIGLVSLTFWFDEERQPTGTVTIQIQDFQNSEEGTFIGQLNPNYFKETIDQVVILFGSSTIPGLILSYYPEKNMLVGGTPQMVAYDVSLFDGVSHEVGYTFKQGSKQAIFYDGQVVAESEFEWYGNSLTGQIILNIDQIGISKLFKSHSIN